MALFRRLFGKRQNSPTLARESSIMAHSPAQPDLPMLAGILVDVSGSMTSSIQNRAGGSVTRLESFRDSLETVVSQGRTLCRDEVGGRVASRIRLFAYGFGFGNPLSFLLGGGGPPVRDLLQLPGEAPHSVPIDRLAEDWSKYRGNVESMIRHMFGATPMRAGFQTARDRFASELGARGFAQPPVLFVLSDGEPTDGTPPDITSLASQLKKSGVLIVSCYVTSEDITRPRQLYAAAQPGWPAGAKLMFECASELPENTPFDQYIREHRWAYERGARLFSQLNQSEVLTEFLGLILSPLKSPSPGVTPSAGPRPIRVFISYSHQDARYLAPDSLLGYLAGLRREGFVFWHDERIGVSAAWDEVIKEEVRQADVALCLVSQAFLNSEYCQSVEVTAFLERAKAEGLIIVPIILSPCDWKSHSWLANTQFLPSGGKTVETDFSNKGDRDRLFLQILEGLRALGAEIRTRR
jgi:hypothetical protein